ncbi:MAG: hypothetical protein JWN08_2777 [Frankiales bacterium]|jgi:hypothetical protein|nr:hypothetical protein [Frankiales bacterium]
MDRLTAAMTSNDEKALRELYAADAVGDSPDLAGSRAAPRSSST